MPYNPQFVATLNQIITAVKAGQLTGQGQAVQQFKTFSQQVKTLGRYNTADWSEQFMDVVYQFGNCFSNVNPHQFLEILDNEIATSTTAENEILYFLKSELLWSFEKPTKQNQFIDTLLQTYPTNAEFLHTFGHIKIHENKHAEALECYGQAVKIYPDNTKFVETKYRNEIRYIEVLIDNEKYEEAERLANKIVLSNIYNNDNFVIHNWFIFLQNRIKDYRLQEKRNLKRENELMKTISTELISERKRTIELLGLFTAIIAFIFTTVSIGKNFEFDQAIIFTICLGLVLLEFSISISILFKPTRDPFYKDIRLYLAVIIGIIIYVILTTTYVIKGLLHE